MATDIHTIEWEAHSHMPRERGSDWYWILGLIGGASGIAALILGNVLFGIVLLLGTLCAALYGFYETHEPITYCIDNGGVHVDGARYPYSKLDAFYIDREHPHGPHALIRRAEGLDNMLIIPIPEEHVDDIDDMLADRIPEEHLQKPLPQRLLEMIGF